MMQQLDSSPEEGMDGYIPGQSHAARHHPAARFEICADALLEAHGGVVYRDPSLRGPCMNGISLGMLSAFLGEPASIGRLMRLDEALSRRIYRRLIWDELGADRLPPGLDLALLAFALEAGPHAAILALQKALGIAASGALDEATRARLQGLDCGQVIADVFAALAAHCLALGALPGGALEQLRATALCHSSGVTV
jgi:lysozyme family protein